MSPIEHVAEKQEQTLLSFSTPRQKYKIMEYNLTKNQKYKKQKKILRVQLSGWLKNRSRRNDKTRNSAFLFNLHRITTCAEQFRFLDTTINRTWPIGHVVQDTNIGLGHWQGPGQHQGLGNQLFKQPHLSNFYFCSIFHERKCENL